MLQIKFKIIMRSVFHIMKHSFIHFNVLENIPLSGKAVSCCIGSMLGKINFAPQFLV